MKDIYFYKAKVCYWDVLENDETTYTALVVGTSYSNAVENICNSHTSSDGTSDLISIYLEELESFGGKGMLYLSDIKESFLN